MATKKAWLLNEKKKRTAEYRKFEKLAHKANNAVAKAQQAYSKAVAVYNKYEASRLNAKQAVEAVDYQLATGSDLFTRKGGIS